MAVMNIVLVEDVGAEARSSDLLPDSWPPWTLLVANLAARVLAAGANAANAKIPKA